MEGKKGKCCWRKAVRMVNALLGKVVILHEGAFWLHLYLQVINEVGSLIAMPSSL